MMTLVKHELTDMRFFVLRSAMRLASAPRVFPGGCLFWACCRQDQLASGHLAMLRVWRKKKGEAHECHVSNATPTIFTCSLLWDDVEPRSLCSFLFLPWIPSHSRITTTSNP
jgi:hypothetical protein